MLFIDNFSKFFNIMTWMLDKYSRIIVGSLRYSCRSSSPLFLSFMKLLDLSHLNVIVSFGSLRIFLKTKGAREMGDSPCG
jgi:hypothetical protein